jgi:hypothetical protein
MNNYLRMQVWSVTGIRGGVVGWSTVLQAARSRVWIAMRQLDFSVYLILPAALWPIGTQPLRHRLCGLVVRVPGYISRGPVFDSLRYQTFWEVVGLERGSLSLMGTTEELHERNSSDFGLENWEYSRGNPMRKPRYALYPQKLALISPRSAGRSAGIVRSRTKATEFT